MYNEKSKNTILKFNKPIVPRKNKSMFFELTSSLPEETTFLGIIKPENILYLHTST